MKRFTLIWVIGCVAVLLCATSALAGKPGRSNLFVRLAGTTGFSTTPVNVEVGNEINIELFIEGRGESITGVDIFLEFDDTYLELIPARTIPELRPFTQGPFLRGTVAKNTTLGDAIGGGGNQFALFQLQYNEDIAPSGLGGGGQRAAVGDGVCATFRVRVIRKPTTLTTGVRVIRSSPTGSETGYFNRGDAGSVYNFNQINELSLNIRGLELDVSLPDLFLLPGQVDSTLDLDDYVDDLANPDSSLVWTNAVPIPDSIQVGINPTSHRVVVDTRVIEGQDTTNFVGISQVRFTATTAFDETVSDIIQVIVDTPPAFEGAAIVDTVTYFEDRDTTFTLVAVDPDPMARLTFGVIDKPQNITPTIGVQTVRGDTVFQTVRMTAAQNFFGEGQIRFGVTDQFGLADTIAVFAVVNPVNDPPRYIKAFPDIIIDALGQRMLTLSEYVDDIDDEFGDLQFAFTGVDSIAFDVTANNGQLIVTPVRPFQGTRTANVVVTDPSNGAASQQITVKVNPPIDPQAPEITVPILKVNVRAGGEVSTTALDPLVTDIDTPDENLKWTQGPISRFQVDAVGLQDRQLRISANPDSTGFRTMTLRVTDPTQLSDTLAVRIYASSAATGIPVAGGMPDITLISGQQDTLMLDDYYFDANHADSEVTWTTEAENVTINIDPNTHQAIFQAIDGVGNAVEDVVLTVTDPQGQTATDTVRVTVLDPGSVVLDLSILGGSVDIGVNAPDTVALSPLVRIGNPDSISWRVNARNSSVVIAQAIGRDLFLVGVRIGSSQLVLTATDQNSGRSTQDSILVNVGVPSTGRDTLLVKDFGALDLLAGRDTTLDLTSVVLAGNLANLVWSAGENENVAVEIDTLNQLAIVRASAGFIGNAGDLVFQVQDIVSGIVATSVASPVLVGRVASPNTDLLKIQVVRNPVLKNFLDVFIRSRRTLQSAPLLDVRIGENSTEPRTFIAVDPVALVSDMWVGDLRLSNETTGLIELAATGITLDTRVALLDTVRLSIEQANVRSAFGMTHGEVGVSLPAGGVDVSSVVALIPERNDDPSLSKPTASKLVPVSDTYMIYSPEAQVVRAGQVSFALGEVPENAGIYREDSVTGKWILVGRDIQDGRLVGEFDAFGRYGVFVDLNPVSNLTLYQNFPNPFNPQTTIRFDLSESDQVQLIIYNALGQEVRHLISGFLPSGRHVVTWNARDDFGRGVSAGVYVYQLQTTQSAITRKMLLLK